MMGVDDRLDDILDAWQVAFERGTEIHPAELCRSCPDLLPELERKVEFIRRMAAIHPRPDTDSTAGNGGRDGCSGRDSAEAQVRTPADHPSWPLIPGYEVVAEIARGGMGVVYAVRDLSLDREVAVKAPFPAARHPVASRDSRRRRELQRR